MPHIMHLKELRPKKRSAHEMGRVQSEARTLWLCVWVSGWQMAVGTLKA